MKKHYLFGFGILSLLTLMACGKSNKNYVEEVTVQQQNDSMVVVTGVVAEITGPNTMSIVSMEGDTMWFTKDGAVIEGSGIVIGDTAVVYYTMEGVEPYNSEMPKAKKIVTSKSATHNKMHSTKQK